MVILKDFWAGRIGPEGQRYHPREEYSKVFRIMERCEEAISAELPEAGLAAFEDFKQAEIESASLFECDSFIDGFRMGARFIMDVLLEPATERS